MKVHLERISNLQALYPKLKDKNLSISTKYKLLKLFNSIQTEFEFYKESLSSLLNTYSLKDENGTIVKPEGVDDGLIVAPDLIPEFKQKFEELMALEVDIDPVEFNISEFENSNLSLDELNILFPFIKG